MRNFRISGRAFSAVVLAELLAIGLIAWIAAGVPGLRHDDGPPSVTIQFAPGHEPPAPVRAYGI
jgi:hypothetical protein